MRTVSRLSLILAPILILAGCSSAARLERSQEKYEPTVVDPEQATKEPSPPPAARPYFDWPVDSARMTRGYLPNRRKPHLGIDLAAPQGTKIFASHEGVVIYAGREFRGYGRVVMIEGQKGFATLYAHLSKFMVREGARVQQGDLIGLMGRSGRASGNHLHFEIRTSKKTVDPMSYLPR